MVRPSGMFLVKTRHLSGEEISIRKINYNNCRRRLVHACTSLSVSVRINWDTVGTGQAKYKYTKMQ